MFSTMMNGIGRVLADFARCNAFNLVAAHVDITLLDGDILMGAVAGLDGQATVIDGRVARGDAVVLIIIVLEVVVSVYSIAIP